MSKKTDEAKAEALAQQGAPASAPKDEKPRAVPTIGRVVHYRLTDEEAAKINRWRDQNKTNRGAIHAGSVGHVGNECSEGQAFAADVVSITEFPLRAAINLQVKLDGNDTFWKRDADEGEGPGTWSWPPRS